VFIVFTIDGVLFPRGIAPFLFQNAPSDGSTFRTRKVVKKNCSIAYSMGMLESPTISMSASKMLLKRFLAVVILK
jgi:hypothetical protein